MQATKLVTIAFATLLAGCTPELERYPIAGSVTLDGRPIRECVLVFRSSDPQKPSQVSTVAVERGRFQIPKSAGLLAGKYDVIVNELQPDADSYETQRLAGIKNPIKPSSIPSRYATGKALQISVDQHSHSIQLSLQSRPR
jgi:hypothetical protein